MNEEIKNILANLVVDSQAIDVAHLKYEGKKDTYIVWTMLPEEPLLAYDDELEYSLTQVDIDIYSKGNYLNILNEIKNRMKNNGWTWTEDSEEMYEEDTKLYHRTSTFEKERKL